MDSKDLWVELKPDRPSYLVLKGAYGQKVSDAFSMSRQGVRWRFQRVFTDMYVSSFETILFIEKTFGTDLREHAIRISKERYALRQKWNENGLSRAKLPAPRRQSAKEPAETDDSQL